jgi:ADP-heptose:LPS heptosyltransferase
MKLVTISAPRPLPPITLPPGTYLMEDAHAGVLLQLPGAEIRDAPPLSFDPARDRAVTIVRPGGFGDLLFLTPLLRRLAADGIAAEVAAAAHYAPILAGIADLCRYPIALPPEAVDAREIQGILNLENILEFSADAQTYPAPELFMRAAYGDGGEGTDWGLDYQVTPEELEWAADALRDSRTTTLIGVQLAASATIRSYPPPKTLELIRRLGTEGHQVLILGSPRQFRDRPELHHVTNPTQWPEPPGIRESIALATFCDAIIAPDSVMAHVAAALEIPLVALYGPFPAHLRLPAREDIAVIEGEAPCAPCFHHGRILPFVEGQPCDLAGRCAAMDSIGIERILQELGKIL